MQNKACKSLKTRCKSALFSNCHFVFHVCTAGDRGMKPIANKAEAMFDEHFWFDIDGHVLFMVQAVELTARERISCDAGTQTYEKVCGFRRCARLLKKHQQKQTHRFKLRSLLFKGLRCKGVAEAMKYRILACSLDLARKLAPRVLHGIADFPVLAAAVLDVAVGLEARCDETAKILDACQRSLHVNIKGKSRRKELLAIYKSVVVNCAWGSQ